MTEYPHIHISTHFRAYFKIHVAGPVHVLIYAVKPSLLVSNCTVDVDLNLIKKKCTWHSLAFIFCRFPLCKEFDIVLQSQFLGNQPLTKKPERTLGTQSTRQKYTAFEEMGIILLDNKYG